ncbi:hypothetical protein Tco_0672526 [Tanacetum coccineum]
MHLSESEDTGVAHLPKIKTKPGWLKFVPEEDTPKTHELDWVIPLNDLPKTENNWADALAKTYKDPEEYKPFHKNSISLQFQMKECHFLLIGQIDLMNPEGNDISKPLPLGGPPGQVIIQTQYFFNRDLKYLLSSNKERRHALSISKLKAAYYPDFRLE